MSQTYYKLYYHLVWGTKNRIPIITPAIEGWLKEYIPKKVSESEGRQLAFNNVEEHVHLLTSIPPKISIAEFVHNIKGSSSHYVNVMLNDKAFYWQGGYGVLSLSEKGIPFVKKYIENQKQRHRDNDLIDILEYIPEEESGYKKDIK